jgi:hypothetical protein
LFDDDKSIPRNVGRRMCDTNHLENFGEMLKAISMRKKPTERREIVIKTVSLVTILCRINQRRWSFLENVNFEGGLYAENVLEKSS